MGASVAKGLCLQALELYPQMKEKQPVVHLGNYREHYPLLPPCVMRNLRWWATSLPDSHIFWASVWSGKYSLSPVCHSPFTLGQNVDISKIIESMFIFILTRHSVQDQLKCSHSLKTKLPLDIFSHYVLYVLWCKIYESNRFI